MKITKEQLLAEIAVRTLEIKVAFSKPIDPSKDLETDQVRLGEKCRVVESLISTAYQMGLLDEPEKTILADSIISQMQQIRDRAWAVYHDHE